MVKRIAFIRRNLCVNSPCNIASAYNRGIMIPISEYRRQEKALRVPVDVALERWKDELSETAHQRYRREWEKYNDAATALFRQVYWE